VSDICGEHHGLRLCMILSKLNFRMASGQFASAGITCNPDLSEEIVAAAGRLSQIIETKLRPVFAETVGEDAIRRWMTAQIDQRITYCFDGSNGLYGELLIRCVADVHLDSGIGTLVINLSDINEIGFPRKPGQSDRQRVPRAEFIGEGRFGNLVMGVAVRTQPLVIAAQTRLSSERQAVQEFATTKQVSPVDARRRSTDRQRRKPHHY
jgi:hypothetical protein